MLQQRIIRTCYGDAQVIADRAEAVAGASKGFLRYACRRVRVEGEHNLLRVLQDERRVAAGQGVLTYCNHISVLDEPLMWGTLPWWTFRNPRSTRWTLGASDIIFKNELYRWFFNQGQTLELFRGQGIFQPALDQAIGKLDEGNWVHIFPEGAVNLTRSTAMRRFKWGVARLLLEARTLPVVIPIWLTGFDQVMPEPRMFPRGVPRVGADVSVCFGPALDPIELTAHRDVYAQQRAATDPEKVPLPPLFDLNTPSAHLYPETRAELRPIDSPAYAALRSRLSAYLRRKLQLLGEEIRLSRGQGPGEGELVHRPSLCGTDYKKTTPT